MPKPRRLLILTALALSKHYYTACGRASVWNVTGRHHDFGRADPAVTRAVAITERSRATSASGNNGSQHRQPKRRTPRTARSSSPFLVRH